MAPEVITEAPVTDELVAVEPPIETVPEVKTESLAFVAVEPKPKLKSRSVTKPKPQIKKKSTSKKKIIGKKVKKKKDLQNQSANDIFMENLQRSMGNW